MDPRFSLFLASLLGIVPSYGILYLAVSRMESKLDEKDTMISFVIGLFAGIAVVVSHLMFFYPANASTLVSLPLLALGDSLLYYIFISRRKFKGREDVVFIGFSFGLGSAATYILFVAGRLLSLDGLPAGTILGMVLFSLAVPLFRGAVGSMISNYKVRGKPVTGVALASVLITLFNAAAFMYITYGHLWTFAAGSAVIGVLAFMTFHRNLARAPDINR